MMRKRGRNFGVENQMKMGGGDYTNPLIYNSTAFTTPATAAVPYPCIRCLARTVYRRRPLTKLRRRGRNLAALQENEYILFTLSRKINILSVTDVCKIDVQMSFVIRRTLLIALKVIVRYKNCLIFELHNLQQGPNYHDNVFDC